MPPAVTTEQQLLLPEPAPWTRGVLAVTLTALTPKSHLGKGRVWGFLGVVLRGAKVSSTPNRGFVNCGQAGNDSEYCWVLWDHSSVQLASPAPGAYISIQKYRSFSSSRLLNYSAFLISIFVIHRKITEAVNSPPLTRNLWLPEWLDFQRLLPTLPSQPVDILGSSSHHFIGLELTLVFRFFHLNK